MIYRYKGIIYEQLDNNKKVTKGKVVLEKGDWDMIRDYFIFLESELHQATGATFDTVERELIKRLGEEKCRQYYHIK